MVEFHDDDLQLEKEGEPQVKRELHALQDLDEHLTVLQPQLLERLSLIDPLRKALLEAPKHKAHIARKRHIQYIDKLIRDQDVDAIVALINQVDSSIRQYNERPHVPERWRDQLIAGGDATLDAFVGGFPEYDRQHLCGLIHHTQHGAAHNKPPTAAYRVFKCIRGLDKTKRGLR